ncbi:uncharacterized protein [Panulirus ornatus]|uniref:uncharacterized protein n=1 Tax=Panulirus ornatus TaxID=150431 RepID=UPI003A895D84
MVVALEFCGVYITKRVPLSLAAGSVLFFITGTICFWMQATADCFDDDEWFDWSCSTYKTRLVIYGSTCLIAGVSLLGMASYMLYKLQGARNNCYIQADPVFTGIQDGFGFNKQATMYQPQSQMAFPQQQQEKQLPTTYFTPEHEVYSPHKSSYYS